MLNDENRKWHTRAVCTVQKWELLKLCEFISVRQRIQYQVRADTIWVRRGVDNWPDTVAPRSYPQRQRSEIVSSTLAKASFIFLHFSRIHPYRTNYTLKMHRIVQRRARFQFLSVFAYRTISYANALCEQYAPFTALLWDVSRAVLVSGRLIDWLTDGVTEWLSDWVTECWTDRLIECWTNRVTDWSSVRLIECSSARLNDWATAARDDWMTDYMWLSAACP